MPRRSRAMGMVGRIAAALERTQPQLRRAAAARASDVAGGLGAISKVLRMLLQSAVLAVGAYLVIHQQATAGIIIAGSILGARALAPVDLAIANWRGFVGARQSWHRLSRLLGASAAQTDADAAAAAGEDARRRRTRRSRRRASRRSSARTSNFSLDAGKALGVIGPTASGKSSLARAAGRRLGAGARQRTPRRRHARPVVAGGARPPYRLPAAGRRTVRRHRGAEHRALRGSARSGGCHRRGPGCRRARSDHQPARRLRHRRSATRQRAVGRPGAAHRACARALSRSVPGRARRAELQSRRRRRRGVDPGDPAACARAAASSSWSRIGRARSPASTRFSSWPRAASSSSGRRRRSSTSVLQRPAPPPRALKVVPDAGRSRMKRKRADAQRALDPPAHLLGIAVVRSARRRRRRLGGDGRDLRRGDRAGLARRRFQRQEGAASDRRRRRRSCACATATGSRPATSWSGSTRR